MHGMSTPEELARKNIDALLDQCGWVIQNSRELDLSAARGIAVREVRLKEGRCDYLLLIDRKPVGIIEAKKEGVTLSSVADQSGQYAENLPDFLRGNLSGRLPFLYESTGIETYFRDERDPHPRSRPASSPSTAPRPSPSGSKNPTPSATASPRCPLRILTMAKASASAVSKPSRAANNPSPKRNRAPSSRWPPAPARPLTACAFTYRLIKHAGARNVLFLVDRANLGRQALADWSSSDKTSSAGEARRVSAGSANQFRQFVTADTGRKFTELAA